MPLTRKVMVLFDADRYQKLNEVAKQRGCSTGALIREAVEKGILARSEASRKAKSLAAKRLVSMREDIPDWDEVERLIARGHVNE